MNGIFYTGHLDILESECLWSFPKENNSKIPTLSCIWWENRVQVCHGFPISHDVNRNLILCVCFSFSFSVYFSVETPTFSSFVLLSQRCQTHPDAIPSKMAIVEQCGIDFSNRVCCYAMLGNAIWVADPPLSVFHIIRLIQHFPSNELTVFLLEWDI